MTRWALVLSAVVALAALAPAADPAAPAFERKQDVIYCRKFGVCLTMDVFTPKGPKNGLGIVAVVSGGWVSSHDAIERFAPLLGGELIRHGYTVFAVVHGSQPKFTIPECIEDMHKAVRYIRHNAKEYGIDPDRIGITGASAGCHLSLMMGVGGKDGDPNAKDPLERESSRVQAVAGFFPPTDFFNYGQEGRTAEPVIKAGPFSAAFDFRELDRQTRTWKPVSDEKRRDIFKQISPAYHVTPQTPPTLLVHGDKDPLVPLQQSRLMIEKLRENKVPCELIVKEGGSHGWNGIEKETARVADWFDHYLLKKSSTSNP